MSAINEKFVSWYLRLNGYFTVDNFVVHAGDDPGRIRNGLIGSHTETDTIALRMPYSVERAGNLLIANHEILVDGQNGRFDIVIAEAKSGDKDRPNPVWRNRKLAPIKYVVRFVGLYDESKVDEVARELSEHYCFENKKSRIRYIVFSNEVNQHYANQGVKYITFAQIAKFIAEIRGQSWVESGIGVASMHDQWDEQLKRVFAIANDFTKSLSERQSAILQFLVSENKKQASIAC